MSRNKPEAVLEFFVVRSATGQYFRPKGRSYSRDNWVDDLRLAKVYSSVGPAKAQATWWTKNYPDYGVPDVVVLEARIVGTAKHKVSNKLEREHETVVAKVREYDDAVTELMDIISESDSAVVCKSLRQQVDDLRAKRTRADREATDLQTRIQKVRNAINSRGLNATE